jgi:DNA-binding transcriptional LysR family regulator
MEKLELVNFKLLYYFQVLAEEKHFGNAAKRIGIEQPPLSLQIKKLEKSIGAPLFDRSHRQVKLTAVGRALLPEAERLLTQGHQLFENIKSVGRGQSGVLNIGFATSTIFSGITTAMKKHRKLFPNIKLRLQELSSAAQVQALQEGTIDVGFIREAGKTEGIRCELLVKEKFISVLSHQHPLSKQPSLKFSDLRGEPFVHFPRSVAPALYDKVNMVFSKSGFFPDIVQEALEWQTIISLVEANMGISICPASFQKLKIGKVQYRELSDVKTDTSISMCYKTDNLSKLITPFLHIVNETILEDVR